MNVIKKPSSNLIEICLQTFCESSHVLSVQKLSMKYELCQLVLLLFPSLVFFSVTFYESKSVFDVFHVT